MSLSGRVLGSPPSSNCAEDTYFPIGLGCLLCVAMRGAPPSVRYSEIGNYTPRSWQLLPSGSHSQTHDSFKRAHRTTHPKHQTVQVSDTTMNTPDGSQHMLTQALELPEACHFFGVKFPCLNIPIVPVSVTWCQKVYYPLLPSSSSFSPEPVSVSGPPVGKCLSTARSP